MSKISNIIKIIENKIKINHRLPNKISNNYVRLLKQQKNSIKFTIKKQ